jgi:short-subunit dehydrogenase
MTELERVAGIADMVVNNAGMLTVESPLSENAIAALQMEMEVNVYGLIRVAQAFAPILKTNGGGVLVQLNSVASLKNFADFATYSASKAITQGLRDKLREQGTFVMSVHPGPIDTDMANDAGMGEMAEPPVLVAEAILEALQNNEFHIFPDSMARQIGNVYADFATNIVEANLMEE